MPNDGSWSWRSEERFSTTISVRVTFNHDNRKQNMAKTILKKKVKRKTSSAKRVAPKPAAPGFDASSLPGPDDILRVELPNGMVVLARENFTSPL